MYEFANLGEEAPAAATPGIDWGVANPMTDSRGVFRAPDKICQERIKRKKIGAKRHQRQLEKQVQGSANSRKTKRKIAKKQPYGRHESGVCARGGNGAEKHPLRSRIHSGSLIGKEAIHSLRSSVKKKE